jgi:hypothetical protein
LYGCEIWFVTVREEHKLRVCENRKLRRIFGSKKEEVVGGWRRLRNEEFCNFCASQNISRVIKSRRMGWVGHVACMRGENVYKILIRRPERKRPLVRPRHRWGR